LRFMCCRDIVEKRKIWAKRADVRYFLDFHGHGHSEMGHSVECGRTDPCLGFLLRQHARLHGVAENALVALHRELGIIAQVVAGDLLPGEAPLLLNDLNMVVSLRVASRCEYRRFGRWNDHLSVGLQF